MSATFPIYPAHTAVLSVDCQTGIVSLYVKDDKDAFLTLSRTAVPTSTRIFMIASSTDSSPRAAVLTVREFVEAS